MSLLKPMKLRQKKELHLEPHALFNMLAKAHPEIFSDCCATDVAIVERTEVNQGRTLILSWSVTEEQIPYPTVGE